MTMKKKQSVNVPIAPTSRAPMALEKQSLRGKPVNPARIDQPPKVANDIETEKALSDLSAIYAASKDLIGKGVRIVKTVWGRGIPIVEIDLASIPRWMVKPIDVGQINVGGVVYLRYLYEFKGVYLNFQIKEVK